MFLCAARGFYDTVHCTVDNYVTIDTSQALIRYARRANYKAGPNLSTESEYIFEIFGAVNVVGFSPRVACSLLRKTIVIFFILRVLRQTEHCAS